MGVNCYTGIPQLHMEQCAWPVRLEHFLNNFIRTTTLPNAMKMGQQPLVTVYTLATGGTNTATGQMILEYDLLNHTPDILFNAYSSNDMHLLTLNEALASKQTLQDKVFFHGARFCSYILPATAMPEG
jgi:hypothetical protein